MSLGIELLAVDLHAPRVDHRQENGIADVVHIENPRLIIFQRHPSQGFEASHRDQRNPGPVANSFGQRHADPQTGVGTGAHSDRHGIKVFRVEVVLAQNFLDIDSQVLGVLTAFATLTQGKQTVVFSQCDGTDVGARLDTQQ